MALMHGLERKLLEKMFPYNKKIALPNYHFIDLILSRTKKRPLNFLQNTAAARLTEVAEREKMHVRAVEKMKMEEVNGGRMSRRKHNSSRRKHKRSNRRYNKSEMKKNSRKKRGTLRRSIKVFI
jgi:hypothetical protein